MSEVLARIKPKGSILFAKSLKLKEGVSEEAINRLNVKQGSSKHFADVFEVPENKSRMPQISKWSYFEDRYGVVDVI